VAVTAPQLIDTNNTAAKVSNGVLDLKTVRARGEVAGVRLGMTMEEVAGSWGKPSHIWSKCGGGPLFSYQDANVIFDPSSNSVMRVRIHKLPRLGGGLSTASSVDQFIAVLGEPAARKEQPKREQTDLIYESPTLTLDLEFCGDGLWYICLERRAIKVGR
jgi:hypothetical protein